MHWSGLGFGVLSRIYADLICFSMKAVRLISGPRLSTEGQPCTWVSGLRPSLLDWSLIRVRKVHAPPPHLPPLKTSLTLTPNTLPQHHPNASSVNMYFLQ